MHDVYVLWLIRLNSSPRLQYLSGSLVTSDEMNGVHLNKVRI